MRVWLVKRKDDEIYVKEGENFVASDGELRSYKWLMTAPIKEITALDIIECVVDNPGCDARYHGHIGMECDGTVVRLKPDQLPFVDIKGRILHWLNMYKDSGSEKAVELLKRAHEIDCSTDMIKFIREECHILVM